MLQDQDQGRGRALALCRDLRPPCLTLPSVQTYNNEKLCLAGSLRNLVLPNFVNKENIYYCGI